MALIDRDAEKRLAEQETEDMIRRRGLASENEIGGSAAATAGSRGRFAARLPGLAESIASRTGLADSGAAAAAVAPFARDLEQTDAEANSLRRVRERRDNANQMFGYLSDRLQESGIDKTKAEDVARQFALDQDRRSTTATDNQRARELTVKKQDIIDQYMRKTADFKQQAAEDERKNAFKKAIFKSIGGLAGGVIGFYAGGPVGAMAGASAGSAAGDSLAGDNKNLTSSTSFSTKINPKTGQRI